MIFADRICVVNTIHGLRRPRPLKQGSHALCPLDMFAVLYGQDSSRLDFAAAFNVIMQKQLQGQRANVSLVINSGLTTLCDI